MWILEGLTRSWTFKLAERSVLDEASQASKMVEQLCCLFTLGAAFK